MHQSGMDPEQIAQVTGMAIAQVIEVLAGAIED
jgi:hypothetical protein